MLTKIKFNILKILRIIRAPLVRFIKPKSGYFLFEKNNRPLEPISLKYGYDRGTPIDRIYIESFLNEHKNLVNGRCLEIHDTAYIDRFGGEVRQADSLDIDTSNKEAKIYGDLRNLKGTIEDNTYDCLIITHTVNVVDDIDMAISECYRILKPGGTLLLTVPGFIGPVIDLDKSFWRFNKNNTRLLLGKVFNGDSIEIVSYGNVLAGQAFLTGLAAEELSDKEIEYNDPHFPIVIGAIARK